jgi:hypothetical protein
MPALHRSDGYARETMLTMFARFAPHANGIEDGMIGLNQGMVELWRRSLKAPALLYAGCLMFIGMALYHFG